MPTVTANLIVDRAAVALQDTGNVRWARAELLGYLNDGQRETVLRKPNAYVLLVRAQLVAGTRQQLPTVNGVIAIDPIMLIEVLRNSTGRAVRLIERGLLDSLNPDWHNAARVLLVQHYCYDPLDPKSYWVYPPSDGIGCVDMTCSFNPPAIGSEGAVITLDDIYQGALLDYVIYRAMSKDAEYAADPTRAAAHYAAFSATLTGKGGFEAADSPTTAAQSRRS